jgi:hypothetical protein
LYSVVTLYVTSKEAAELLTVPTSGEATLGSSNVKPSDSTIQDAKRGTKDSKKRRKQCPQWVTVVDDDDNDKKVDNSSTGCVATASGSGKRQVWPLTDHFERLLKGAYPNHAYPHQAQTQGL